MASYTDAIAQFNPYVQQLPVELMAKVGMQKQAQYDQGVQKIQSYIDNVAGVDVIHEADKQYLHSKLGELGNRLRTVAAGDFSNQQLVNSVTGMTGQIIKDPTIQNAVASTAWYKKQKEELDKAYRDGKSSIANVKDFERQATAWLSKNEAGQRFTGRYSPYIDLGKKWNEIIKTVHPNASSEDFAYQNYVGADGKFHSDKLAAAMTRITKEGVTANQIENAIRSSLTPDDYNQLRIDGAYRFDGVDSEGMKGILATNYQSQLKKLDSVEESLKKAINVVAGDPVQLELTTKSLNDITEQRLKLKKSYEEDLSLADTNLDSVKTNLYKEGAIGQAAYSYSWEKKAKELLTNPILQADFEKEKINISRASAAETARNNRFSNWIASENLKVNQGELQLKMDKAVEDKYGVGSGFTTMLGKETGVLGDPVSAIQSQITELSNSTLGLKNQLGNGNAAAADLLISKYQKDVNSVTPRQADAIKVILGNEKRKQVINSQLQAAERLALANDPTLANQKQEVDKILQTSNPLNIVINGRRETFSPAQILQYVSKFKLYNTKGDLYRSGQDVGGDARVDENTLSPQEKLLHNYFKNNPNNAVAKAMLNKYTTVARKNSDIVNNIRNATSAQLSQTSGDYVPAVSGIVVDTPKARAFYETVATSALSKYSFDKLGIKGGSAMINQEDAIKAQGWLGGPDRDKIQYQKLNYAGEQHLVLVKGEEKIIIPLSSDQQVQLPKLKGEINAFNEDINKIQIGNGNYSTNPTHDTRKSWYQPWDMNTSGMNVYADLERNYTDAGIQHINFSLKDKDGTVYPLSLNKAFNANGADEFIRGLTNKDIKDLYLASPSIPQAWKEKIKNL